MNIHAQIARLVEQRLSVGTIMLESPRMRFRIIIVDLHEYLFILIGWVGVRKLSRFSNDIIPVYLVNQLVASVCHDTLQEIVLHTAHVYFHDDEIVFLHADVMEDPA